MTDVSYDDHFCIRVKPHQTEECFNWLCDRGWYAETSSLSREEYLKFLLNIQRFHLEHDGLEWQNFGFTDDQKSLAMLFKLTFTGE